MLSSKATSPARSMKVLKNTSGKPLRPARRRKMPSVKEWKPLTKSAFKRNARRSSTRSEETARKIWSDVVRPKKRTEDRLLLKKEQLVMRKRKLMLWLASNNKMRINKRLSRSIK